jgi:serine/threonine protein phosphatase PrpC
LSTSRLHYRAAGLTDRGRKRSGNEDAFGYSIEHGVYVLSDGMGGAAAGEIASAIAVEETMRLLCARQSKPLEALVEAVIVANHAVYARAQQNRELRGMGATLVAMAAEADRAWIANVGDSRGYRLSGGRLEQITQDHSYVEEQIRIGRMTPAEALNSPLRNVITRAVGTQSEVEPDVFELDVAPGDLFLLCSDGLTRELADGEIEAILRQDHSLEELCARLVHDAIQAGGGDNITCILARAEQQ